VFGGQMPTPIGPEDAAEFAEQLAQIGPADLAEHCAGCSVEDCLQCASVIREFITSRLTQGISLFIEDI
jgi:hypothetical protein